MIGHIAIKAATAKAAVAAVAVALVQLTSRVVRRLALTAESIVFLIFVATSVAFLGLFLYRAGVRTVALDTQSRVSASLGAAFDTGAFDSGFSQEFLAMQNIFGFVFLLVGTTMHFRLQSAPTPRD